MTPNEVGRELMLWSLKHPRDEESRDRVKWLAEIADELDELAATTQPLFAGDTEAHALKVASRLVQSAMSRDFAGDNYIARFALLEPSQHRASEVRFYVLFAANAMWRPGTISAADAAGYIRERVRWTWPHIAPLITDEMIAACMEAFRTPQPWSWKRIPGPAWRTIADAMRGPFMEATGVIDATSLRTGYSKFVGARRPRRQKRRKKKTGPRDQ